MGSRVSRVKIESDLLSQLSQKTQFTEEDLKSWNLAFLSECPNGRLSQIEFASIFKKLFPLPLITDKRDTSDLHTAVDHISFKSHNDLSQLIFKGFPANQDNTIDFKGFATVLSIICRGSIEAKSEWLFGIIDSGGIGRISHQNLVDMFTILVSFIKSITGHKDGVISELAKQKANIAFSSLGRGQDDTLSCEDFTNWIIQNEEIVERLDMFLNRV